MLTLIAARPGAIQEVLNFFFSSAPGFEIIGLANDDLSTLEQVKIHHPALVVVDGNLPAKGVPELVRRIKTEQPQIKTIVLANGTQQEQQLLAMGADAVLHRGVPISRILGVINSLLGQNCSSQASSQLGKGS